ncbi:MAG TPA: hypothetical protein VM285_12455 [Polyangia bacterium]|nr:hypothetical protein [Polyangia bacterium]
MARTFDRWVDISTASEYTLQRELDETLTDLAYDLRVCGRGYPSPRKETVREIIAEQERRKARRYG